MNCDLEVETKYTLSFLKLLLVSVFFPQQQQKGNEDMCPHA